jgi:putative nucleotidyltransferase with HDIG domain
MSTRNSYKNGRMHALFALYRQTADWQMLCDEFPWLEPMAATPQDAVHHGEGDVATHTRMVLDELMRGEGWDELADDERFLMFWTAVFHDVGKPKRTVVEPDGRITSKGHSKTGAQIAREAMRLAGMPFAMREHMCALISAHQAPFWLFEKDDQVKRALRMSVEMDTRLLIMHARADARGRVCADPQDIVQRVELSRLVFEELGVYGNAYPFANGESMVAYFAREDREPSYAAYEDHRCTVTVLSGLPGSGKNFYEAHACAGLPSVSLDATREQLGFDAEDNQGTVIQAAYEEARTHLRARRDFVWNTTNITLDMRAKITQLLRDYDARIRMVYIEVAPEVLLEQNGDRKMSVPVDVIENLVRKLEPPKLWEAHEVVYEVDFEPRRAKNRRMAP